MVELFADDRSNKWTNFKVHCWSTYRLLGKPYDHTCIMDWKKLSEALSTECCLQSLITTTEGDNVRYG